MYYEIYKLSQGGGHTMGYQLIRGDYETVKAQFDKLYQENLRCFGTLVCYKESDEYLTKDGLIDELEEFVCDFGINKQSYTLCKCLE